MSHPDQHSLEALRSLKLTPREAEVLFWISEGKSNQDIGLILDACTGTICKHVEHILSKLNVENRTTAALIAHEKCWSIAQPAVGKWGQASTVIISLFAEQLAELWLNSCEIYNAIPGLAA